MSSFYVRELVGMLVIFSIFVGVFFVTQAKDPHISELAFIESSAGKIGSVIPASCASTPPINHSGDCPPVVDVNMGTGSNNLTASITGVTSVEYIVFSPPNTWIVGNGGQYYDTPFITINIGYTSGGGSTKCRIQREQNLSGNVRPSSGSIAINVYPQQNKTYLMVCSDGVYFKSSNSIKVIGNYTNYNSSQNPS